MPLGIVCLALGSGMILGLTQQTAGASLRILKYMARGMGGALAPAAPLYIVWFGGLLCISARRRVSFRSFAASLLSALCLLAFLTLITYVSGFGSLLDKVHSINTYDHPVADPGGFAEYLSCAYQSYYGKLEPLPGGGAFGMLLAYPVWKMLGPAGGAVLMAFATLGSLFFMLGVNPVRLLQKAGERRGERRARKLSETPAAAGQSAETGSTDATEAQGRDDGMPATVLSYGAGRSIPAAAALAGEASALRAGGIPEAGPMRTYKQPVDGFRASGRDLCDWFGDSGVPDEASQEGKLQPARGNDCPVETFAKAAPPPTAAPPAENGRAADALRPAVPPPHAERSERGKLPSPAEVEGTSALSAPGALRGGREEENNPPQAAVKADVRGAGAAERDEGRPEKTVSREQPAQTAAVGPSAGRSAGSLAQTPAHEVTTAAAVPLTGERIPVARRTSLPAGTETRLDGTPAQKAEPKQMRLPITDYDRPPVRLLSVPESSVQADTTEEDARRAERLLQTLASFNIPAQVQQITHGPAITRFAVRLAEGVNVNRLRNVMDNIAVELLAKSPIRAEIPIPGTPLIGIEVSNERATKVYLSEVLNSARMREVMSPTMVALGKDITGAPVLFELMDMPHLLIAGATGSGKSVCINSIITSLLYRSTPDEVRLILVDPKFVELQPYNDVPHLLLPVVTDPKKAVAALDWVCQEMDERYRKLQECGARNIDAYNKKIAQEDFPLPKIILVVDEMGDLMATCGKAIDEHVKRITAKARAAGICLILATQRPSVDVITGVIKANIPSRIAFQVSSLVDSRTILDMPGAEKLLGLGDMLYLPRNLSSPKRVQGCFISDHDVQQVTEYVKSRNQAQYNVDIIEHLGREEKPEEARLPEDDSDSGVFDELLPKAIEMAVEAGQMSISMLQRVLRVGYGRAGRLIDEMEKRGVISGNEGTKPRKTLITREEYGSFDDERTG